MCSIIVDDTTDVANEENVSLYLRYIVGGDTVETFATGGESLYKIIQSALSDLDLDM